MFMIDYSQENNNYPLASLIICFYNQEAFVADTIAGALSQTYPNCEIILSDDCSTDKTFEAIQEAVKGYEGPHKIIVNRNEKNMGLVPHINKVLFELSRGEILCLNGGDDVSLPNRVLDTVNCFVLDPQLTALTMSYDIIDKYGEKTGGFYLDEDKIIHLNDKRYLKSINMMWGTTALSIKRVVIDTFGLLNDDCQTEDSVLRFRSILIGTVLSSKIVGLKRRVHDTNMSHNLMGLKTEFIAKQYQRDFDLILGTLPKYLKYSIEDKIITYKKYRKIQEAISKIPTSSKKYHIELFFLRFSHSLKTELYCHLPKALGGNIV